MADYGNTSYESFWEGGKYSFEPDFGINYSGGGMNPTMIGFPGSPQTANQLGETVTALKQGVKSFEVQLLMPETAEQIPVQHFKEMRALMKLSGVKPSVHGPVIDPAGFGEKGYEGDFAREDHERRMWVTIENAQKLDPTGNIPVVFHAVNGVGGPDYVPGDVEKGEERFKVNKEIAIDVESGKMTELERDFKFRPRLSGTLKEGED